MIVSDGQEPFLKKRFLDLQKTFIISGCYRSRFWFPNGSHSPLWFRKMPNHLREVVSDGLRNFFQKVS